LGNLNSIKFLRFDHAGVGCGRIESITWFQDEAIRFNAEISTSDNASPIEKLQSAAFVYGIIWIVENGRGAARLCKSVLAGKLVEND
jgi:hypothetical protein